MTEVTLGVDDSFIEGIAGTVGATKTDEEIVLVVPRAGEKVLLHTKAFYPEGVYRLPSGRMHRGETPEQAFAREFREELGAEGKISRPLETIRCTFISDKHSLGFTTYIYLSRELEGEPAPEDESEEITEFREVPVSELKSVAEQLRNLEGRWRNWGKWRAIPHDIAAEALTK